jgi:hypothetical protein
MITSKELGKLLNLYGVEGKAWTQNTFAKTAEDFPAGPLTKVAAKWCLWGGCIKLGLYIGDVKEAFVESGIEVPKTLVEWNDSRQWPEVRSGLMKAMIFLKEREDGKK